MSGTLREEWAEVCAERDRLTKQLKEANAQAASYRHDYVEALERARQHQARAEAAEAKCAQMQEGAAGLLDELAAANAKIEMAWRSNNVNVEALAAARRECDRYRTALMEAVNAAHKTSVILADALNATALAAPAAREEGKR